MSLPFRSRLSHVLGLLAGLGALLVGDVAALAQSAPAPAPSAPAAPAPVVSEASRREARLLGEKLGWEPQVRSIIGTVRNQVILSMAQANSISLAQTEGKLSEPAQKLVTTVDEVMMPAFVAEAASLLGVIVDSWAESFSADELRNLRSFYNTPLGDKLLKTIPQLNGRVAQVGQQWAQRVYQDAKTKQADEIAKRGFKFAP